MDQKIKALLGDLVFNIAALQSQVETLQTEIERLKNEDKPSRKKSD